MLSDERAGLVRALREGPGLIRRMLRGCDDLLDTRSEPGTWTIREIVHHLADAELMAASRLRRLLAEEHPQIRGFDEVEYTRRLHYERPLEASLDLLASSRRLSADLLETLDEAEWAREGMHVELGPYSVEELVRRAVRHCQEHAEQIRTTQLAAKPDAATPIDWAREGMPGQREHQLHVQLAHITPPIWRRLVIPDTTPLPLLHRILQTAFGWGDRHLHQFRVAQLIFAEPDDELSPPAIDEQGVRLLQLHARPGDRCTYEYDAGGAGSTTSSSRICGPLRRSSHPDARLVSAPVRRRTAAGLRAMPASSQHSRAPRTRRVSASADGPVASRPRSATWRRSTGAWLGCPARQRPPGR